MSKKISDAPQNLAQFKRWAAEKGAAVDPHYLAQVDRKWRSIGRMARFPASLRSPQRPN